MANSFSLREGFEGVYLLESKWDQDMQITKDLVDDSPYIEWHDVPESRPLIEFQVANAYALYEVVSFDPISEIYTCTLRSGNVISAIN